jgi:hypothetical protein
MQKVQITATKQSFLNLFKALQESKDYKGLNFAKLVINNCDAIKDLLLETEKMATPSKEFIELAKKAQEFLDKQQVQEVQTLEANPENAKLIEERKAQMEEVNKALQEEATIELAVMTEENLPEDISANQYEALKLILI